MANKEDFVYNTRNGGLPGLHNTEVIASAPGPIDPEKLLQKLNEDKLNRKAR